MPYETVHWDYLKLGPCSLMIGPMFSDGLGSDINMFVKEYTVILLSGGFGSVRIGIYLYSWSD